VNAQVPLVSAAKPLTNSSVAMAPTKKHALQPPKQISGPGISDEIHEPPNGAIGLKSGHAQSEHPLHEGALGSRRRLLVLGITKNLYLRQFNHRPGVKNTNCCSGQKAYSALALTLHYLDAVFASTGHTFQEPHVHNLWAYRSSVRLPEC
jgi:hypothetical protein